MLDLDCSIDGVGIDRRAAGPTLIFALRLGAGEPVHTLALRCQVVIDARRRRYLDAERARLTELFGSPEDWHRNLGSVAWADVAMMVPGFDGEVVVPVRVPCTYDMEVASSTYLHGVDGDPVPLLFQLTGTAFLRGPAGISVERLPHDVDARWSMPAATWHDLMEVHFPGARWLRVDAERFDRLARYKRERALPTWDAVVDKLLQTTSDSAPAGVRA